VVVTAGAIGFAKLQSNHYHQQINMKSFFTGWILVDLRNESDALFTVNQCVQYQSISHDLPQTKAHSTITETEIGSRVLFVYDSRWTEEQHIVARS